MEKEICITVPPATRHFSLFAEGCVLGVYAGEPGEAAHVILDASHPVALYYHVAGRRRLFICMSGDMGKEFPKRIFPETLSEVSVLTELSGRAYDRYKRTMEWAARHVGPAVFTLPPDFFLVLAELCRGGRNSGANISLLLSRHGMEVPQ